MCHKKMKLGHLDYGINCKSCVLIHKGCPQQVSPHVSLGRIFMLDALPDSSPEGFVSPPETHPRSL